MKIESIRTLDGMNIHCYYPVVVMRLDLEEYTDIYTDQLGNSFVNDLFACFPGLYQHKCSKGYVGGFFERVNKGTLLGHIIEHVCLELQFLAGIGTYFGKTRFSGRIGVYNIIFEYKAKYAAIRVAQQAVMIVDAILQGEKPDICNVIDEIKGIIAKTELGPSTAALVKAAKARHIPVLREGENSLIQLGYGSASHYIQATITDQTRCLAVDIACNKALTKKRLEDAGLPTPYGKTFRSIKQALTFALKLNCPIVVKPLDGNQGKGVSLALTTKNEVEAAYHLASDFSDEVIVEEYIEGQHYRCTVVNGKLVAAALRVPAHIIGDGKHTISELIALENQNPLRGKGHDKPLTYLQIDGVAKLVLKKQSFKTEDIPVKGDRVYLRQNANLSTGGMAYDVTAQVHDDNRYLVEKAAQIIGLDVAGVDCVMDDISKSYKMQESAIIEINAAPGIRMHHHPAGGDVQDVAAAIIDYLFPQGETGRIPIITVTGTNGKTTTVRLLTHVLKNTGAKVGMTTTDGVYINDECVMSGDTTGPISAGMLLTNKNVEIAVLELARGGLIRGGLAFDESDMAIVTNISEDHLDQDGIETLDDLVSVKTLVVEAVKADGHVILNADDAFCSKFAHAARCEIVYFSQDKNNEAVSKHLEKGGKAVYVDHKRLVLAHGTEKQYMGFIKDIPITFSGKAIYNVYNILAAIAAGWAFGMTPKQMQVSLKQFKPVNNNPGRQNLYKLSDDVAVLVDYAHNVAGYQAIMGLAQKLGYASLTGVICAPGDRNDRHIRAVGAIAGHILDRIIIKEDCDLRGRAVGETAQLLYQGCVESGDCKDVKIILSEEEAIKQACLFAQPGELIIILYEKLVPCLKTIEDCALYWKKTNCICKAGVATSS